MRLTGVNWFSGCPMRRLNAFADAPSHRRRHRAHACVVRSVTIWLVDSPLAFVRIHGSPGDGQRWNTAHAHSHTWHSIANAFWVYGGVESIAALCMCVCLRETGSWCVCVSVYQFVTNVSIMLFAFKCIYLNINWPNRSYIRSIFTDFKIA